jgi:hypothetical protein
LLSTASGQPFDLKPEPQAPPRIEVAEPTGKRRVTVGYAFQPETVSPGGMVTLFLRVRVADGHHIYALGDSGGSSIPTSIEVMPFSKLKLDGLWEGPEAVVDHTGARTLKGDLMFRARLLVDDYAAPGRHSVSLRLNHQICNESICWPPDTIQLESSLNVVASQP